jgi:hypothetical protein
MTDYKMINDELVPLTPEEQAEFDKQKNTPRVNAAEYSNGPTIAEAFGEPINVKP